MVPSWLFGPLVKSLASQNTGPGQQWWQSLSNIRNADLILVMKDGNIIEQGNHEELIAQGGFYADLYNSQFTEDQAEE